MKKTFWIYRTMVLFALISLAGLTNPVLAAEKVRLGILCALSGPAAPWGIPNSRGITLDAETINKNGGFKVGGKTYELEVLVYDHKYIPAESAKAANKAIFADKCNFLAIQGGAPTMAAIPLMKENNILSLNFAGGADTLIKKENPLLFIYNPSIELMYASVFPYLKKKENIKTLIIVNPNDTSGKSGTVASKAAAEREGFTVIAEEFFERGSKDLTSLLTRIISKKPDLIDTSYTDPTTSALMCKQARELGYKGTVLLAWGPAPAQVKKIAGPHSEKAYMVVAGPLDPRTEAQKKVYKTFVDKWGEKEWDSNVWPQYGLASSLVKGIEAAQSLDPFKIAAALEKVTWDSPVGKLRYGGSKLFGAKRHLLFPITLYQFQNGEAAFLGTLEVREGVLD
jgi:branched-chain amino acid transport system substrate-binding protein